MITAGEQIETLNIKGDSLPWVPFVPYSDEVLLKYFQIDPVHGEILVSMKFPPGLTLPTHYHTGIVAGHTMKGAWRYLEHDWVSEAGDTVYETAAPYTPRRAAATRTPRSSSYSSASCCSSTMRATSSRARTGRPPWSATRPTATPTASRRAT
jgi:hypothetical protein